MDSATGLQAVAAIAAAAAAIAAWRSVALSGRQAREAREPLLVFDLIQGGLANGLILSVENIGSGVIRKASFRLVADGRQAGSWLTTTARLRPGERVDLEFPVRAMEDDVQVIVIGIDFRHVVHVWDRSGKHRRFGQRRWARLDRSDVWAFKHVYGVDVDALPPMEFRRLTETA